MNWQQCGTALPAGQSVCQVCGTVTVQDIVDTARFQLLRRMFDAALQVPQQQWPEWLQQACGGDAVLYRQMAELLTSHAEQAIAAAAGAPPATAHLIRPYPLL